MLLVLCKPDTTLITEAIGEAIAKLLIGITIQK